MRTNFLVAIALAAGACVPPPIQDSSDPDTDDFDDPVAALPFTPIPGTRLSGCDLNPVFTGAEQPWSQEIGSTAFLVTGEGAERRFHMWYIAYPSTSAAFGEYALGYATSEDGARWAPYADNPVHVPQVGTWDRHSMSGQAVVWDAAQERYVMAYQGFTVGDGGSDPGIWGMGIATSPDGLAWTQHAANPVLDFNQMASGNQGAPCWPLTLSPVASGWEAWLAVSEPWLAEGSDVCAVRRASASSLGSWTIEPNVALPADRPYDAKGVAAASVVELDGTLYLFYVGFAEWVTSSGYKSASKLTLNLAISDDGGQTWTKDPANPLPVHLTDPPGVSDVSAHVVGSAIHLWVTDSYGDQGAVGLFRYEPGIAPHP